MIKINGLFPLNSFPFQILLQSYNQKQNGSVRFFGLFLLFVNPLLIEVFMTSFNISDNSLTRAYATELGQITKKILKNRSKYLIFFFFPLF